MNRFLTRFIVENLIIEDNFLIIEVKSKVSWINLIIH